MDVENWDEDDFQGDFGRAFSASVATAKTSVSSRLSVHSESVAGGDDDWNFMINDEPSQAVESAQKAGIPLPKDVPSSALLGGTIKRLGKQKSRPKMIEDWDNDMEMPDSSAGLKLKTREPAPSQGEEHDDFEDLEGSLGIRFAGTRRDMRSSSASAMSPSLGSVTAESEEGEMRGLELPEGPMDFGAMLNKRRAAEAELSDLSHAGPVIEQPSASNAHKKSKLLSDDHDSFVDDFDFGGGEMLDARKRTMNKNIKVKNSKPTAPTSRPATTINFHDKPTDKPVHTRSHIPRPVSGSKPAGSRLEPVFESSVSHVSQYTRDRQQPTTTTSSQLLRSKRSAPALRGQQSNVPAPKPPVPFAPSGSTGIRPHYAAPHQKAMPLHLRRESDPSRVGAQSPPPRSHSRLSNSHLAPETPSRRQKADMAPAALAREAAAKRTVTKPARRRNYGDGNELEVFDDLPTSSTKETKYSKQPIARGPPKSQQPPLRQRPTQIDLASKRSALPDRMTTPAPPKTPVSPTRAFAEVNNTPSYLRDTAASRIARESRLANHGRPRSEGPLMPLSTNWKAQVAARSPHSSPRTHRSRGSGKAPQLIKGFGSGVAKTEKGMVYNPDTLRWEGNENGLPSFEMPPPLQTPTPTSSRLPGPPNRPHHQHSASSPSRPALIAPMSTASAQGVQVNGGMVFDPRQMRWLKMKHDNPLHSGRRASRRSDASRSPSAAPSDEEDAFAGIEDLKDENTPAPGVPTLGEPFAPSGAAAGGAGHSVTSPALGPTGAQATGVGELHEEFDLGPRFRDTQGAEEAVWRKRCERWFPEGGELREDGEAWKWGIRGIVGEAGDGW